MIGVSLRYGPIVVTLTAADVESAQVDVVGQVATAADRRGLVVVYGHDASMPGNWPGPGVVASRLAAAPRHVVMVVLADPATGQVSPTARAALVGLIDRDVIVLVVVPAAMTATAAAALDRQLRGRSGGGGRHLRRVRRRRVGQAQP